MEKKCGTDPYCPPVWAIPSDDTQLINESDEKLPAGTGKPVGDEIAGHTEGKSSHENAIHDVPELYHRHCQ